MNDKEIKQTTFPWRVFITSFFICAGGSFHFGYQLTIINPTEWIFRRFMNESCIAHYQRQLSETTYRLIWSLVINMQLIGTLVGTIPLAYLAETLGRRKTFFVSCSFTAGGLLLQTLSKAAFSFELLATGRFLTGVGTGLSLGLEPMYLTEITPVGRRGLIGSMTGIFVEFGFFIAGVASISDTLGTPTLWPYMFAVELIPVVVLFSLLPFMHESPRYLLAKGEVSRCKRALKYFGHADVEASVREIESEIECQNRVTLKEVFETNYLRRAAYLGTLVAMSGAFSGIIAIDYFSTKIFTDVGLSAKNAQYASLGIFFQCFLSAVLGGYTVDRVGRRFLMLIMTAALIVGNSALMILGLVYSSTGIAWVGYFSIVASVLVCLAFGFGPSILQWTTTSEMVPQKARSSVQLLAMIVQKVGLITTGFAFFPLEGAIGPYCFLIFIIPLAANLIIFAFKLPETRNKTVVEVLKTLGYEGSGMELGEKKPNSNVTVVS